MVNCCDCLNEDFECGSKEGVFCYIIDLFDLLYYNLFVLLYYIMGLFVLL